MADGMASAFYDVVNYCRRHGTELPRWIVAIVMPFVATLTPLRETIGRALALTNWIRLLWSAFGASHLN